jgi:hypothetical protein
VRPRLLPTAALALLALLPARARADYKDNYRKGVELAEKGNWAEVARHMQAALSEQPREGEQVKLYGMRFEPYLPQYYLGLALFNTGDCEGALRAWDASAGQGAVQKTAQFKTLQKDRDACQQRVAKKSPTPPSGPDPAAVAAAVKAAEAEIAKAEEAGRGLATLEADPALAAGWAQDAALGGSVKQARELIAAARGKLNAAKAKGDLAQLADARDTATRAAQQMEGVWQEAGRRKEAARLAAEKKAAEDARRGADLRSSSPGVPPPAAAGPPAELVQAARAYFGGQYRAAAEALAHVSYASGPAAVQALLFRAAARHSLYVIGGQKDDGLRQSALSDVQALRKLDPRFTPDPQAFSPRFRTFFKSGS